MSTEQVLREYPWLSEHIKWTKAALSGHAVVKVSRISLELFLRREYEKFDGLRGEEVVVRSVSYLMLDGEGGFVRGEGEKGKKTLFESFCTLASEDDQANLVYILRIKSVRMNVKDRWAHELTLYKPPHGYKSVKHFVDKFSRRLRRLARSIRRK